MAFLALRLDLEELEHEQKVQQRRRELHDLRVFCRANQMLDNEFVATYRLPKQRVFQLIQELRPHISFSRVDGDITPDRKILIALNFFATGTYQRNVGQVAYHGVSQSSVSKAIKEVVHALNHDTILRKYIKFPQNREQRDVIKNRFYELYTLPGVIGVIDCTHVAMLRPSDSEYVYFNRKQFHSLNVQVICDADMVITSVDASWGGSNHDCAIWQTHQLNGHIQRLYANGENVWLLGDSGYPQWVTMMTPIINAPERSAEAHYTDLHVVARCTVERCFGVLKARWRCISCTRKLSYSPTMVAKIVNACCVLHNIAIGADVEVPEMDPDIELEEQRMVEELEARQETADEYLMNAPNQNQQINNANLILGRAARAALVRQLSRRRRRRRT